VVVQQNTFVLFLLLRQDPDLLLEVFDGFPEFLVDTVRQARHHRKPQIPFHSPAKLIGRWAAGKCFRQTVAQVK
jgi:hypothetical protein